MNSLIRSSQTLCLVLLLVGCGLERKEMQPQGVPSSGQSPSLAQELNIKPEDWTVNSLTQGQIKLTTRALKPEKLEFVRKNFKTPRFVPVTVPEANGFELFEVKGYSEFESALYIQPKVYINTGTAQGSILGYKVGDKDANGKELVEISIPVALVNGLVPAIPLVGGPSVGSSGAIKLPEKYQIPDLASLKSRVGKEIQTLPVCPKLFRLTFEDQEYWTKSPFEGQSICPLNQFFRVKFQAPAKEMKRMLETAAIRDESVTLITHLSTSLGVSKLVAEVQVSPDEFQTKLLPRLGSVASFAIPKGKANAYSIADIEESMIDTMFKFSQGLNLSMRLGTGTLGQLNPLIANYFGAPFQCPGGGVCRTVLGKSTQHEPIGFSWEEIELLFSPIETQTVTALGPVANSSLYQARPSQRQLSLMRRPRYFKGRNFDDVISGCREFIKNHFAFNPENTEQEKQYFVEYCNTISENTQVDDAHPEETDGYYPLGSNTVVYPGAWLKIDIDEISELTTARRKVLPNGRVIVESKIIDLLSPEFGHKTNLTTCIQGSQVACMKYKAKKVDYRDPQGTKVLGPCEKGSPDCVCSKKSESEPETCTRTWYDVLDYECDPVDLKMYCPYWRTQEEVVDYEIEYDCQNITKDEKTSFLCIGGCKKSTELVCKEKGRKPVKAQRQRLNCIADDPQGIAPREPYCSRPKYKCEQWSENCTQYHVNEVFQIVHEEVTPQWRPFAIEIGEYPKRFEQDLYLKFVSPNKVVTNCRLERFAREFRGNSIFIKLPSEDNEGLQPCDGPLWEKGVNTHPLYYPKVFIKNTISYPEERLCGKTEYSFLTKNIQRTGGSDLVPGNFSREPEIRIGPVEGSCLAESKFRRGNDYWFIEYPPIRFSGRVSVLGRILESIVTEAKQ